MRLFLHKILQDQKLIAIFSLFFIALLITVIWFKDGNLYAGGDIGFPTYDPSLLAEIAKNTWWGANGPGFSYPTVLPTLPFYLFLSLFQILGASPLLLQIIFLFCVLSLSIVGGFLFVHVLSNNIKLSYLSALFYLLNPYTMMNILHRFNHTSMVMFIIIPWTAYFLYKGLVQKQFRYILLLTIISSIGGYSFGTPAFLVTWWFLILFSWLFLLLTDGIRSKKKGFYALFLLSLILIWFGANLWWLLPFMYTAPQALDAVTTVVGNIESFKGVSKYFSLPFAFRGVNLFFLTEQQDWGGIYVNHFFNLLSWIGFVFVALSFFKRNKEIYFSFFAILLFITLFVSKGSGQPFGGVSLTLFSMIPALGIYRNPFEKFGILLPLASSFLFASGVIYLESLIKQHIKYTKLHIIVYVLLFGFLIAYQWPVWIGRIFGRVDAPPFVEVPQEYATIKKWFSGQNANDPVTLHLPYALGDSLVYSWDMGYNGLEISTLFFPGSSISHFHGVGMLDRRLEEFPIAVKNRDEKLFKYLLDAFGIDYIVNHSDIDFNHYRADSPANISSFLQSLDFIRPIDQVGKLTIYGLNDEKVPERIYFSSKLTSITGDTHYLDSRVLGENGFKSSIYQDDGNIDNFLKEGDVILPSHVIAFPFAQINKKTALSEMPFARFTPDNFAYFLIRAKEGLALLSRGGEEKFLMYLTLSNKRLSEVYKMVDSGKDQYALNLLKEYKNNMRSLVPEIQKRITAGVYKKDVDTLQFYQGSLLRQKVVLESYVLPGSKNEVKQEVESILNELNAKISELGLSYIFPVDELKFPTSVVRFKVSDDGSYKVFLSKDTWGDLGGELKDYSFIAFVDGKKGEIKFVDNNSFLISQPLVLKKGIHEIAIETSLEFVKNKHYQIIKADESLISNNNDDWRNFTLSSRSDVNYVSLKIDDSDPNSIYEISLQDWVENGLEPTLSVIQDIDPFDKKGRPLPALSKDFRKDDYSFYWNPRTTNFTPNPLSRKLEVRISLLPWDNCRSIYWKNPRQCEQTEVAGPYRKISVVHVKDFAIRKVPVGGISLVKDEKSNFKGGEDKTANYKKVSETKYEVETEGLSNGVLVFRGTYNDGWKVKDLNGDEIPLRHVIANGYANGWFLSESLNGQKVIIEYEPQNNRSKGLFYGSIIVSIAMLLIIVRKKLI